MGGADIAARAGPRATAAAWCRFSQRNRPRRLPCAMLFRSRVSPEHRAPRASGLSRISRDEVFFAPHLTRTSVRSPWVSPFGDSRIKGCSRLPGSYRSVPRPSSPVHAKAFTRCPYLTLESPHHQRQYWVAFAISCIGVVIKLSQIILCVQHRSLSGCFLAETPKTEPCRHGID